MTEETSAELKSIKIYRGVTIYRVPHSQNWMVRVWDSERKKYVTKTSGTDSLIQAREVAKYMAFTVLKNEKQVEPEYSFKTYALKLIKHGEHQAKMGERNLGYVKSMMWCIQNADWGLLKRFGFKDVRENCSGRRSD